MHEHEVAAVVGAHDDVVAGARGLERAPCHEAGLGRDDRRAGGGDDVLPLMGVAGPLGAEARRVVAEAVSALDGEHAGGGDHRRGGDLEAAAARRRAGGPAGRDRGRAQAGGVAARLELRPPRRGQRAAGLLAPKPQRRGARPVAFEQLDPHPRPPRLAGDPVAQGERGAGRDPGG